MSGGYDDERSRGKEKYQVEDGGGGSRSETELGWTQRSQQNSINDNTSAAGGGTAVEDMIQARENEFLAELAVSQNLQKGHPLQHMIATFDKMNSLDQIDSVGGGDVRPSQAAQTQDHVGDEFVQLLLRPKVGYLAGV